MPTTEHIHLPLYTDEETPDLSTTGHYNAAMHILDTKGQELSEDIADEREARTAGDAALEEKLATETAAREAADTALEGKVGTKADAADVTALGNRVDNAEAEISANSADLTGIKGLTYGTGGQVFLEEENGEYSSPALEEIQHEISDLQDGGWYIDEYANPSVEKYDTLVEKWPKCALIANIQITSTSEKIPYVLMPAEKGTNYVQFYVLTSRGTTTSVAAVIATYQLSDGAVKRHAAITDIPLTNYVTWPNVKTKPFSTIGSGLKVENDALTVDTSALPSGGSGITVIDLGDALAADVYAKVKDAWPNCVLLSGSNYLWPSTESVGTNPVYLFFCVDTLDLVESEVTSTSITTGTIPLGTSETTFGDLTAGVTS